MKDTTQTAKQMIETGKYNHVVFQIDNRYCLLTFNDEDEWLRFVKNHCQSYIGAYHRR